MTKVKSKLVNGLNKPDKKKVAGAIIVLVLTLLGVKLLIFSHAQSPYASVEAESGTRTSNASVISDGIASGGNAVQFGSPPTSALAIHISNGNLVDQTGKTIRLLGANVQGTEAQCVNNAGFSFGPLDSTEASAIRSWKMNAVRIPLNEDCWLGINGSPAAYSGSNYQTAIKNWVSALNSAGIYAILDLHWANSGTALATSQRDLPDATHAPDFWTSVAGTFKNNPAVLFDLYNEPSFGTNPINTSNKPTTNADWSCWLNGCYYPKLGYNVAGMQTLVTNIRDTGANQPILIGGLFAASDPCGTLDSDYVKGSCMWLQDKPTDPDNQLGVSLHTYANYACGSPTCWNTSLAALTAAKIPLVTLEFGDSSNSCGGIPYSQSFVNWADQNNVSYLAWSWITGSSSCDNLRLLSNWSGAYNTSNAMGKYYYNHLQTANPL